MGLYSLNNDRGLTLVELLVSLSLMASVATSLSFFLTGTLRSYTYSTRQGELRHTAQLAMVRIARHIRQANRILLPLENNPTRSVLALGGFIDNDSDGLYDEDPPSDLTNDGASGIVGVDDDGDGNVDEDLPSDDDEDGQIDQDTVNGIDDDGDGAIDEDASGDIDDDLGTPQNNFDDDGDGLINEDPVEPIVYYLDTATNELIERYPLDATSTTTTALADNVALFQVQRMAEVNGAFYLDILLRLQDDQGYMIEMQTQIFPRNQ